MVNNTEIQQLFDDAVNRGLAPGFQYAIFNQTQLLVNGTSGLAKIASETDPHGVPMQPETILWVASAGKILVSLATLIVLERGLAHNGMTLDDLDNHEKLVEILPEFRHGSGSLVTKTVTGFEEQLDPNGKKVPILHDTKGKITLRDLMTHTSGFPYFVGTLPIPYRHSDVDAIFPQWNDELMLEFVCRRRPTFEMVFRYSDSPRELTSMFRAMEASQSEEIPCSLVLSLTSRCFRSVFSVIWAETCTN